MTSYVALEVYIYLKSSISLHIPDIVCKRNSFYKFISGTTYKIITEKSSPLFGKNVH